MVADNITKDKHNKDNYNKENGIKRQLKLSIVIDR